MNPVSFLVCWAALAQLVAVKQVIALTNAEFCDLIKDYVTDDGVVDEENGVIGDSLQDDNGVIHLPGGPDDELDVEYIADKLGLTHSDKEERQVGLMRRHHHWCHHHRHHHWHRHCRHHWHHHRRHHSFSCGCHHYSCSCTFKKTFSAHFRHRRRKFALDARVTVAYLKSHYGFEITFVINGHRLYHKEISLVHPPPVCVRVPSLPIAKVCIGFYNINLRTKHLCVRLSGVLDLKIKRFRIHFKLGCFTIPILDEQALTDLLNDPDFLLTSVQESQDGSTEVELQDLAAIYRQLQEGLVDEDSQDAE